MPTTTGNLSLLQPIGSDAVSELRIAIAANAASLGNASVWLTPGTISAQPAASTALTGAVYPATDTGTISQCTGTAWLQIWPALQVVSTASPAAGDYDIVDAGVTATLPAPTLNAIIALEANAGVSGSAPCYFAASDMFGPGIPDGAASLAIGTPGTVMWFIAEGSTRWRVLAGQQDTGWVPLTINTGSGFAADASSGVTPAARIVGDTVQLCGGIVNSGGTSYTNAVFTLPAGMAPPTARSLGVVDPNAGAAFALSVTASTGVVYGSRPTWPPGGRCPLDGASFRLI